jgi:hypothetical protein
MKDLEKWTKKEKKGQRKNKQKMPEKKTSN